jgi:hypothetical protein
MTTLFDSARIVKPATFAKGIVRQATPAPKPAREPFLFSRCNAADMARIDAVRHDAYVTALKTMSQAEAEDFAGDASVVELEKIWAEKAAAEASKSKPSREKRAPYTAADLKWAASNLNANTTQYEVVGRSDASIDFAAGCSMAQNRMDAGYPAF